MSTAHKQILYCLLPACPATSTFWRWTVDTSTSSERFGSRKAAGVLAGDVFMGVVVAAAAAGDEPAVDESLAAEVDPDGRPARATMLARPWLQTVV